MLQSKESAQGLRNTLPRRTAILATEKSIGRLCQRSSRVTFLPGNLCVKSGRSVRLTEALTMEYIRKHTTIPVPKVFCAFEHNGTVYIAMERLSGTPLGRGWTRRSEATKADILRQLQGYVNQLRDLPRPSGQNLVAAIDGGPFLDERLPGPSGLVGPFASGQGPNSRHSEDIQHFLVLHDETSEDVCFTHNDLSSLNILVEDQQVTGIIDWENAAWLPSYWEYTSAWHVNPQNMFWQDEVNKLLGVFERELEMEKLRRRHFGDY
ncbi:hypothetical protein LTR70_007665 [Exophiala xenobiotica]|uniref:Aminoglycoside phosphotransferase domain-containing protein n=1 Tax=Lithohypha guttulata TaxID=1690604 RepID=A0ABR0K2G8_9EURO|nr:hypothetical protein LTR24_007934 [Lithohypha guttulata]KAK5313361.1 hypothetical protein LTR70_007665 [Exophiala xenobiotica]